MFIYHYRIFDRYNVEVVSLAVCTEVMPVHHTAPYQTTRWGCELTFRFPVVRLQEIGRAWEELEQDPNPFAVVVMAHLKAREVREGAERKQWKLRLMRGLYERGCARDEILALFRFIDWLLVLPAALEQEFWHELHQLEEERRMPYVTSVERLGMQKGFEQGLQQGLQQGVQQGLQQGKLQAARDMLLEVVAVRFGGVPDDVLAVVRRLETVEPLHALLRQALTCTSLEAFRAALHTVPSE
jgi:hypothetical protein